MIALTAIWYFVNAVVFLLAVFLVSLLRAGWKLWRKQIDIIKDENAKPWAVESAVEEYKHLAVTNGFVFLAICVCGLWLGCAALATFWG